MKLRNKKTGEIVKPSGITYVNGRTFIRFDDGNGIFKMEVHSLAELNEGWEDVPEEPKKYWYIDCDGEIISAEYTGTSFDKDCKSIGNYFETKEEAEKAVEKLKAWKRLKDKGFRFTGYTDDSGDLFSCQVIRCSFDYSGNYTENRKDLDLLFSVGDTNVTKIGGEKFYDNMNLLFNDKE